MSSLSPFESRADAAYLWSVFRARAAAFKLSFLQAEQVSPSGIIRWKFLVEFYQEAGVFSLFSARGYNFHGCTFCAHLGLSEAQSGADIKTDLWADVPHVQPVRTVW